MTKEYKEKKVYSKDRDQDGGRDYDKYNDMDDAMGDDSGRRGRKGGGKKKACRFMSGEEDVANISYKNPKFLSTFMTEHGKIVSRRITGNCAMVQRKLAMEIKKARNLALLGFTSIGPNSN